MFGDRFCVVEIVVLPLNGWTSRLFVTSTWHLMKPARIFHEKNPKSIQISKKSASRKENDGGLETVISEIYLRSTMAETLKVIFLDIDGVLLPFPRDENSGSELFPASTLSAFQSLLIQSEGAKVVLSSTWRVQKKFIQDIVDAIQGFGIDFDAFFDITDPKMHSERQWEIEAWLSNQPPGKYSKIVWLALDDEELIEGDANRRFESLFEGHVVKTRSDKGLTMDDVDCAMKLWKKQLSE